MPAPRRKLEWIRCTVLVAAVVYVASALVPFAKSDAWWIRVWDFPRLQLSVLGFALLIVVAVRRDAIPKRKAALITALTGALGTDIYRIAPYTPLFALESLPAERDDATRRLRVLVANVLQTNRDADALLRLIEDRAPDVVFLVEVDEWWTEAARSLRESHAHRVEHPLSNTYGLALYSRLQLVSPRVTFLVEEEIPSVQAHVRLGSGDLVRMIGLHPRPPHPQDEETTERDAELVIVARMTQDPNEPVVVMGDLNDVAWSHTTRIFRRISGLLDPRVGRGPYATFPARFPYLRFPLDYVFHSKPLRLVDLERLPDIGSDHLALVTTFSLEPPPPDAPEGPTPEPGDEREAEETIERAD